MNIINLIVDLLPLIAVGVLFLGAVSLLAFWVFQPKFGYMWLTGVSSALLAWLLILFTRPEQNRTLLQMSWEPESLLQAKVIFTYDAISWSLALCLVTIALALILTDVARAYESDWLAWAGSLLLTAIGILGVLAGNPLTLLFTWSAIDIAELLIFLWHIPASADREKIVASFSSRIAGTMILLFASLLANFPEQFTNFQSAPAGVNVYLIVAAGLRLGVLPLHLPLMQDISLRRGLVTMLRSVPAASSLVLLARISSQGFSSNLANILLALTGLTAVIASLLWVLAKDELEGRPYWILGLSAFALAAAIRGESSASLAWGITMLLSGGLIFLASVRLRKLLPITLAGLWGLSLLPFSPGWFGVELYHLPFNIWLLMFPAAHALLMIGYFYHSIRVGDSLTGTERWVGLIYPLGLAIITLIQLYLGLVQLLAGNNLSIMKNITGYWPGLLSIFIIAVLWFINRRLPQLEAVTLNSLKSILTLGWFYRSVWSIYKGTGRSVQFISELFEGESGFLWSFLLLALTFALFTAGLFR